MRRHSALVTGHLALTDTLTFSIDALFSSRTSDQAKYVAQLLAKLGGNDRTMVVEIVERLAGRLAKR